ncbi:hypothetical protein PanWU01x14_308520 [Parasponia andersonii]|uniref:DUF1985 domain-containing protein n=1 Tax=Parasponia andersonii TaxID=3476 RepID=A0A2P5AQY3_PARAD|nr:hypothetical protein PanWU01x14_308520 [Parasponia andersonii]
MANALRSQRGKKKKTETLKTGPALINSSLREWKPLIEEKDYCKDKINIYSSFQVIDDVKEKLTQRQKHLFAQTCFGQFLQLKRIQFHGQLIHYILLRQLVCPAGENSMWFRIGGKEYEFGLKKFALITGLDCSEFGSLEVENQLNNRIRDRYFDGKDRVIGKDLDRSFKNCDGNNDEDVVKLAQLYLLERFLFGKDSRRPTEKLPIGLVDKVEDFNKFPWDRLLYNCLKHSIKNLLRSRDKKISKTPTKDSNISYLTYELHGFPYVLQLWVYECIPLIGKKLAHRIDQKMPRMWNWATTKQPNSKSLENEVFNADELQVKSGLQLTEDEINKEKRLKKKNEAASMEEEDLSVDKAQENVSPGKSHEEYEGNGTEDDLSKEYS